MIILIDKMKTPQQIRNEVEKEKKYICKNCGREIYPKDIHILNGKYICRKVNYLYEVVRSKSPEMPIGKKFWTNVKFTKLIGKEVELSDVKCRDYFIKLIEIKNRGNLK